jgi:CheY-like chemotaxis protein
VEALYSSAFAEKGLALKVDLEPAAHWLVCDRLRLRQVLGNLVSNALKFTDHGQARVSARLLGPGSAFPAGAVSIGVEDTGIGIAPGKLGSLFKDFSQGDASTTRRYGGTGLGLAIASRLVEAMGGTLTVASEAGRGATFTAVLPAATAAQVEVARRVDSSGATAELDLSPLEGRRVLLAEDNVINRRVAVALLTRLGLEVKAVENGREALEAWAGGSWDAVVMDVQMPELDGLQATRAIRAEEARRGARPTPILAMTASAFLEDRRACLAAGMNEMVTKPTTLHALQGALVRVLAASSGPPVR